MFAVKTRLVYGWLAVGLVLALIGVGSSGGGAFVAAGPLVQATATAAVPAMPLIPTLAPETAPDDGAGGSDLETLAAAVEADNLEWQNVTFWQGGLLGDPQMAQLALSVDIGDVLPDFDVPLRDGGRFVLAEQDGPLLLNFWASWCGPCTLELPVLLAAYADPAVPFELALVNIWDDEASYTRYADAELPATLTSARATEALGERLGLRAIPVSILLDADRQVRVVHVGNVTDVVLDFLYAAAATPPPSPAADDTPPLDIDPALIEEVDAANTESHSATFWAGEILGLPSTPSIGLAVGDKLPGFGLVTTQGDLFRIDMVDEPYLLNFWASWCGPCVAEFPLLIEHSRAEGTPYGLAFVNVWDDPLTYREFLLDYPVDILSVTDLDGALPDLYGLDLIPVSMLVDPQGRIELIQVGPLNEAALALADELSRQ